MAFRPNNLAMLQTVGFKDEIPSDLTSNSLRMWAYKSEDLSSVIDTSGYFNEAVDLLKVGDAIWGLTNVTVNPAYGWFVVKANNGTTVDVANISSVGLANSD